MPHTFSPIAKPGDLLRAGIQHRNKLIAPVVAVTILAGLYAIFRTPTWEATQALVVRDEAAGNAIRPGKFGHIDEMKTSQETLLELVKSRGVISSALAEVGPPDNYQSPEQWPSPKAVEDMQGAVKLSPPKGAEFGKTEVFYLKVQASTHERAVRLASAICRHLQGRFEQLRDTRAQSVTSELTKTVSLAKASLDQATASLGAVEKQIGRDLSELRILNEQPSGDSDLRRSMLELEKEIRTYRATQSGNRELLKLLSDAQVDPGRLLASPSRLLRSQPALQRLKDGLVDAQLKTAQLLGTRAEAHPQVKAAKTAEQEIGRHLHSELAIAIRGVEVDLRLTAERINSLHKQHEGIQNRLARLAAVRAEYANLVSDAKHRTDILKTAQEELAEAQASKAGAHTANLVSLVDHPDAGTRPIGPGRTVIVLGGMLGGLVIGCGLIFLSIPTAPSATTGVRTKATGSQSGSGAGEPQATLSIKQALTKLVNVSRN